MRTNPLDVSRPPARHRLAALAALAALAVGSVAAQTPRSADAPIRFRHLGVADGLAHPDVHAIHQDATGFLWFGTEDGLTRYDGTTLRVYRSVPFDTTSIPHPWTVALADAPGGGLWVAGESGALARYDPHTDAFSQTLAQGRVGDLWTMAAPGGGPLWLGGRSGGLYRFDPAAGAFSAFSHDAADPASLAGNQITALLETERADGGVWVGTQRGGLDLWRPNARAFRHHRHAAGDATSLPDDYVTALSRDRDGTLWVGTHDGLAAYERGRFTSAPALRGDAVWSILQDPAGALWLGTSDGLVRYDPTLGTAARYRHNASDPTSLGAGDVRALLLDRGGVLWAATESGLSAFVWAAAPFEHIAPGADGTSAPGVWSFHVARDGTLWVGTEAGLDRFGAGGVTHFAHTPGDAASLAPGWVMAIWEDADGALWIGTKNHEDQPGALQRFSPATGRVTERFVTDPGDADSLPSDNPWGFFQNRRGQLWVLSGGDGCPSRFDRAARTFTPFCLADGGERQVARSVVELSDGRLLFGTWGSGLAELDVASGAVTFLRHDPANPNTPTSDYVSVVRTGVGGTIWLGTYGAGFGRYDPGASGDAGTFKHYSTGTSDLPNDVVYSIEIDAAGDLWISTNAGLTRFSPDTETFETFGLDDGLQDLEFNAVVSLHAASGEMLFGGINGFNRFFPDRLGGGAEAPPVVITDVRVDGALVAPAPDGPLAVAAPYAETVRLGARQRDVAFSFAALDYRAPERTRYRVKLDGYDDDWREPGAAHTATYTNLSPGNYTFRVQAAGSGGVWGSEGAALSVRVQPRVYQAWWFRLLAGLALVGAAGAAVGARERRRRETERRLEAQVAARTEDLRAEKQTTEDQADRLREMDRLKTRFFTNVSHEFRTPLTLTIGPLEDLDAERGALPSGASVMVDLALRNSRRLLRLIDQLLDVARLEAGEMRVDARPTDLGEAVGALALSFAPLAERRRVAFETDLPDAAAPDTAVWALADGEKLEHIVVNLLSNAFKFTPEGGQVRVEVTCDATAPGAVVRVRDSGPGIAPADLTRIFDRFYQADETAPGGSGIGLSLAKDFAELHGGALEVESVVGFGTLFTLRLPSAPAEAQAPPPPRRPADGVVTAAPVAETEEEGGQDDRMVILVADDNADIRAYVRSHLVALYRVIEAPDGVAALALARRHLPDLIVSDVAMPGLDGLGLVRALRADRETDFVPVILLTARAGVDDQVDGLEAGADAYVVKPFSMPALQARIDGLIASRRRLRSRLAESLPSRPAAAQVAPEVEAEIVTRARRAVEARLGDEDLTVEDVADALGTSRSTLHRHLRAAAGQTPTAFLRTVRLTHAAALLRDGSGTVSEVAYAVGFKSVSHFSQSFRAQYGKSPSAYADGAA